MSSTRGVGWTLVDFLNEKRREKGMRPLSLHRVSEFLKEVRALLVVEDKPQEGFEEAVGHAREVLARVASELKLKEGDLVRVLHYWREKGRISEEAVYVLEPLLSGGEVPLMDPRLLMEHVQEFAERCLRSLKGRGRYRLKRIGGGEAKAEG